MNLNDFDVNVHLNMILLLACGLHRDWMQNIWFPALQWHCRLAEVGRRKKCPKIPIEMLGHFINCIQFQKWLCHFVNLPFALQACGRCNRLPTNHAMERIRSLYASSKLRDRTLW